MGLNSKPSPFCFVSWYFHCLNLKTINISILIVNTAPPPQKKTPDFPYRLPPRRSRKEAVVRVLRNVPIRYDFLSIPHPAVKWALLLGYFYPVLTYLLTQHFRAATDNSSAWNHKNLFTWKISNLVRCIEINTRGRNLCTFTVENNGLLFPSVTQLEMCLFSEACEKSIPNTWKWRLRELIRYIGLFLKVIPLNLNGYCYIGQLHEFC